MVKARDSYGQVMSVVQKAQDLKNLESLNHPDTPMDSTGSYILFKNKVKYFVHSVVLKVAYCALLG